ncbi:unnamed protein product [Phaeothamnion confervicola]
MECCPYAELALGKVPRRCMGAHRVQERVRGCDNMLTSDNSLFFSPNAWVLPWSSQESTKDLSVERKRECMAIKDKETGDMAYFNVIFVAFSTWKFRCLTISACGPYLHLPFIRQGIRRHHCSTSSTPFAMSTTKMCDTRRG